MHINSKYNCLPLPKKHQPLAREEPLRNIFCILRKGLRKIYNLIKKYWIRFWVIPDYGSNTYYLGKDYYQPAMPGISEKLSRYLNFRRGFFIEVGAADGYNQSNTFYLEKRLQWKGLLIEAIPELFERCKKNRRNSYIYNCALVAKDYPHPSIELHYAGLMSVVNGALRSKNTEEKQISDGLKAQNIVNTYSINVPARTLESVLQKIHNLPKIDFFSLDVEGYELEVLKGLNIDKYAPRYILVEARFFEEVNAFLDKKYKLIEQLTSHDYLYKIKE